MQKIFGPEACGKWSSACTPKGMEFTEKDALRTVRYIEAEYMCIDACDTKGTIVDLEQMMESAAAKKNIIQEIRQDHPSIHAEKSAMDINSTKSLR